MCRGITDIMKGRGAVGRLEAEPAFAVRTSGSARQPVRNGIERVGVPRAGTGRRCGASVNRKFTRRRYDWR